MVKGKILGKLSVTWCSRHQYVLSIVMYTMLSYLDSIFLDFVLLDL